MPDDVVELPEDQKNYLKGMAPFVDVEASTPADKVVSSTFVDAEAAHSNIEDVLEEIIDSVFIPAGAMTPSTTNGATASTIESSTFKLTRDVMVFAGSGNDTHAEFSIVMPESWNRGTIQFKVLWSPGNAAANPGEYVEFYLAARGFRNATELDNGLSTPINVEDVAIADDQLHTTPAGELDITGNVQDGDLIHFKLSRDYDHAGDGSAMDVDARVYGLVIKYTKTQTVSAW